MRAAILAGPGRFEVTRVPIPRPAADEVRVRIEGCGVCASNIDPWQGQPWFTYPFNPGAPGHEAYGRVEALGSEVSDLALGQRVAILSSHGFAEFDVAPARAAVGLPVELDDVPLPGEPLGCAMNIFQRSGISAGQRVGILGAGFLGALLVQLASRAGARVIALVRRPFAARVATAMGAEEALIVGDPKEALTQVQAWAGGEFCDVTIEATGKQGPLDLAAEITRERGRLVIAGYHQDGPRQVNMQLWNWRGLDVINAHERDAKVYVEGIRAAVNAIRRQTLEPSALYTHHLPLEEIGQAFELTRDRPEGFMKALVHP